jgi:flagellar biosynthetic protein FliO
MEVIEQMAAVALVLLLLGATLWVLRRRGFAALAPGKKSARRRMECLERLSLGPQHALHLVRVGDRELLLASSPSGCALVQTLAVQTLAAEAPAHRGTEVGR